MRVLAKFPWASIGIWAAHDLGRRHPRSEWEVTQGKTEVTIGEMVREGLLL